MAKPSKGCWVRNAADSARSVGRRRPARWRTAPARRSLARRARLRSAQRWVALHRGADLALARGGWKAHVEHHHHVGADGLLHGHRRLGGEQVVAAVDVALEARPVLGDGPLGGEREDLEAARVGEDGPVPAMKRCSPPSCRMDSRPGRSSRWARENDLGPQRPEVVRREPGHRPAQATGMKAGVSTRPCGVVKAPRRAPVSMSADPRRELERHASGHRHLLHAAPLQPG